MPRSCCMCLSSARMWPRSLASRFDSGSSIRKTAGRRTMARARPRAGAGHRRAVVDSGRAEWSSWTCAATSRTRASISAFGSLADLQRIADVLGHRHVRIERVGLEHHGDVAVLGQRRRSRRGRRSRSARWSRSRGPRSCASAVVLPQPDSPSSTRNSPGSTVEARAPAARVSAPKDLEMRVEFADASWLLSLDGAEQQAAWR